MKIIKKVTEYKYEFLGDQPDAEHLATVLLDIFPKGSSFSPENSDCFRLLSVAKYYISKTICI